jgi:uncharacterized protein (TIGR02300 family)
MSTKAQRGTKRTCQSCGSRFYDLNRDPIVCPICSVAFAVPGAAKPAVVEEVEEAPEVVAKTVSVKDAVPAPAAMEGEEVPEVVPEDELADIAPDVEIEGDEEEDTFLEEEEDDESEISDLIDSPIEEGGEEEV